MQQILSKMSRAIRDYNLIEPGDKLAVGVSGGKDSITLLEGLSRLRSFIDIPFDIVAITVDPRFGNVDGDFSLIESFCAERGIKYEIVRTQLSEIIFDVRKEKNPCSLCARMRRGILHDTTKALGCNKIALGHHKDDVVETFVMNLLQEGRIGCFQPMTYLSRKDIKMIRPMIYLEEKEINSAVKRNNLPVIPSGCPVDKTTTRQKTKEWIWEMRTSGHRDISEKIFGAIQRSDLKGWNPNIDIESDD